MFAEVKDSLPISGDDYDAQIIREIKACALDLTTSAEIQLPGEIAITRTQNEQTGVWTITDNSTNYGNLLAAYNSLKGQLRLSKTYTTSEVTTE